MTPTPAERGALFQAFARALFKGDMLASRSSRRISSGAITTAFRPSACWPPRGRQGAYRGAQGILFRQPLP